MNGHKKMSIISSNEKFIFTPYCEGSAFVIEAIVCESVFKLIYLHIENICFILKV